jgi:hypothetical protein
MTENQALPGVKIELSGSEYELVFNLYAFAKLKKVANLNAFKGEIDFMNPDQLLYFLWAGILTNHPEFDGDNIDGHPDERLSTALRQLGIMLTIDKMSYVGQVIREAFANATKSSASGKAEAKSKKQ